MECLFRGWKGRGRCPAAWKRRIAPGNSLSPESRSECIGIEEVFVVLFHLCKRDSVGDGRRGIVDKFFSSNK